MAADQIGSDCTSDSYVCVSISRLYYRCIMGKKAGQKWCGNVPWTEPKEKKSPLSDVQLQPSCLPPARNPFKAPAKSDKDSEWRRMQAGAREEKSSDSDHKPKERESRQKENVGEKLEEGQEEKLNTSDSYRGRQLPPGMKIKKRVSDEDGKSVKTNGVEKLTDKTEAEDEANHTEQGKAANKTSSSGVKINETSSDATKNKKPTTSETNLEKQTVPKGSSKSEPGSSTQASTDSDKTRKPTSESSETRNHQDDEDNDDDDLVLVSVKPATQKTPPVSTVQKTLTAFPGFQPASKIRSPVENPKGLHSLLTAQLQQKKVSEWIH